MGLSGGSEQGKLLTALLELGPGISTNPRPVNPQPRNDRGWLEAPMNDSEPNPRPALERAVGREVLDS